MWLEIKKLCMVKTYANVKEILLITKEVERMLRELGDIPFEPLKEKEEERVHIDMMLEKRVNVLSESFIKFLKGSLFIVGASPSKVDNSTMCQICKASDHIATTCLRIGDLKLKCVKCGLPYKMENCGVKCGYCASMGHMKDK